MDKLLEGFWTYVITFVVLLFLNQLLFFGMCLSPMCLTAATPHVLFLTAIIGTWLIRDSIQNKPDKTNQPKSRVLPNITPAKSITEKFDIDVAAPAPEITQTPSAENQKCPKCSAPMLLKTASRGKYQGKQFLGCSQWPKCSGIVNL